MFKTIPASDVLPGMYLCFEYAPGFETETIVWEVVDNGDGTLGFSVSQFGVIDGYRADEHVTVLA